MLFGNKNPSLANVMQNSFRNNMYMDMHNQVNMHTVMTNRNAANIGIRNKDGSIVCGKTVCGNKNEKVKF